MMPLLSDPCRCTGCAACMNVCAKQAITMRADKEGFLQPSVDEALCVQCGLCTKTCPVLSPLPPWGGAGPEVYAAWHRGDRRVSSSGGAFSAFARRTLEKKGVVFGAAFDDRLHLRHVGVMDVEELSALRGSKYVQSEIGDTFGRIRNELKNGREVMFCGTPCQVAGLRSFLHKPYDNLLTLDLACHGVPSERVFHRYLKKLKNRLGFAEKGLCIENYEFRRRDGWGKAPSVSTGSNCHQLYGVDALYMEAFNASALFRKSCYHCPFAALPRIGDITIADFWGIGRHGVPFKHDVMKGVSLVIANSERGKRAMEDLGDETFTERRTLEEALVENHNLNHSSAMHPQRDEIIEAFLRDDVTLDEIDTKYHLTDRSLKGRVKTWAIKNGLFDQTKRIYNWYKTL